MSSSVRWEPAAYDRLATPHVQWAEQVLERLELNGDEAILDAGCGTGRLTQMLVDRVPRGRVVGADLSPEMLAKARETLGPDVELIESDLTRLVLHDPVDVVFSTAVFHWIMDHEALFDRLFAALRPGGRLAAQCGGEGNIAEIARVLDSLSGDERFAPYLRGQHEAWNYASVGDTVSRLERVGFEDARAWLEPWPVTPQDPGGYLRTVILPVHLDLLPDSLHDEFVAAVLSQLPGSLSVEYVRLNISARRPG